MKTHRFHMKFALFVFISPFLLLSPLNTTPNFPYLLSLSPIIKNLSQTFAFLFIFLYILY